MSKVFNADVYVAHLRNPMRPDEPIELRPDTKFTLRLQKYLHQPDRTYKAAFRREVPLNFELTAVETRRDQNPSMPLALIGFPCLPLPTQLSLQAKQDPILRSLHPEFQLIFRYDPKEDLGCLVHFGYHFGPIEDIAYRAYWVTAVHLDAQKRLIVDPFPG